MRKKFTNISKKELEQYVGYECKYNCRKGTIIKGFNGAMIEAGIAYYDNLNYDIEIKIGIKDLGLQDVIHCKTEDEANTICKMMHEAGLKRCTGYSYLDRTEYDTYKEKTCYLPYSGQRSGLDYFKKEGYTIYNPSDFIEETINISCTSFGDYPSGIRDKANGYNMSIKFEDFPIQTQEVIKNLYNNKPTMTKLQEAQIKKFFTEKVTDETTTLIEQADIIINTMTELLIFVEHKRDGLQGVKEDMCGSFEHNDIKEYKHFSKQLKAILKSIGENKTMKKIMELALEVSREDKEEEMDGEKLLNLK